MPLPDLDGVSAIFYRVRDVGSALGNGPDDCDDGDLADILTIDSEVGVRVRLLSIANLSNCQWPESLLG